MPAVIEVDTPDRAPSPVEIVVVRIPRIGDVRQQHEHATTAAMIFLFR